jgi:hypothetical protein
VGIVEGVRARRRYRRMARALAELDGLDRRYGLGALPPPARPRRRLDPTAAVALVVVLLFLALATPRFVTVSGEARPVADAPPVLSGGYPPLPADAGHRRVLPPVRTAATGAHVFLDTRPDGSPVRFDPCRPVRYVVNPEGMPDGGAQLLRESIAEISAATGLAFVDEGTTTERLIENRDGVQEERYGQRWAPVLIAWPDDSGLAFAGEEIAGVASPHLVAPRGRGSERYVTGFVGLNRTYFAEALADPAAAAAARGIVLHELGHLVGLAHAEDPAEVMHATSTTVGLGPGDRQGLAVLGAGDCHTDT